MRAGRCLGEPGALLAIISGPSGVGKDTIIEVLRSRHPDPARDFVVTCTTREQRRYEVDGQSYHFLGAEAFAALREHGALLEASEVHGNWYGTPRDQVIEALATGRDAILKIDVQGARAIRQLVPDALLIFLVPPSLDELYDRLAARRTESPAELRRRYEDAALELARQDDYDHVVVNATGDVVGTAQRIDAILREEHELHPDRRVAV
ncbi:MAG: guanylate kinase [Chloroflexi bacterium]|nr:guanylate kinase [Chloroflexota bacterium]MBA3851050.1 guanylate kinase [Chloroflexota bacterium]